MKTSGRIVILSGPSGSGKTTLYKRLLTRPKLRPLLVRSVSATTRRPRVGEKAGRDYIFLSPEEFISRRKKGYFLEWKKVFTNYYGTPLKPVLDHLRRGRSVLLAIDVQGAKTVGRRHSQALKIFVKTPTFAILEKRLSSRATESPENLAVRLARAKAELREAKNYDYVVVNDSLAQCSRELERILLNELKPLKRRA